MNEKSEIPYFKKKSWKIMSQSQLPYLPTPIAAIKRLFNYLDDHSLLKKDMKLVDLGAGDGRIILYSAEHYGLDSVGVEINEELIQSALQKIAQKGIDDRCRVVEQDFYNFDISGFDIIFLFVLPSNHKYLKHVIETIKEGALVITVRYGIDDIAFQLDKIAYLQEEKKFPIHIYQKI